MTDLVNILENYTANQETPKGLVAATGEMCAAWPYFAKFILTIMAIKAGAAAILKIQTSHCG